MKPAAVLLLGGVGIVGVAHSAGAADEKAAKDAGAKLTFAKDILPLMKDSCTRCHGAPQAAGRGPGGAPRGPAGGLRLDSRPLVIKGGKHGKAVIPGKSEDSLLYKVLKGPVTVGKDEIHSMPKAKPGQDFEPLADEEIKVIKQWIDQGAK